ncbi:hypothetical protein chiPu_0010514 [Chiloscyllium punctatum]|uniref:Uncharacterized protein n=1 Tax=Chiloscyllium punctatum TaxID=137246 RepID=A0A401SNT2_CHIPU|nr:hypothetical protein [Chiloscyllium punctatum]
MVTFANGTSVELHRKPAIIQGFGRKRSNLVYRVEQSSMTTVLAFSWLLPRCCCLPQASCRQAPHSQFTTRSSSFNSTYNSNSSRPRWLWPRIPSSINPQFNKNKKRRVLDNLAIEVVSVKVAGWQGSQDSLLEITYRSTVPPVLCDPTTPKPEDICLPQLCDGSDLPLPLGSPLVDQSMFENSNTAPTPKHHHGKTVSTKGVLAGSSTAIGAESGGKSGSGGINSQHLKSAFNLGKAMGAKVNDLLRRKEQSTTMEFGVTEVNKNAEGAVSVVGKDDKGATINNGIQDVSDTFPRLEPPPPTVKKRTPRALKTTQDMMISSVPVVNNSTEGSDAATVSSVEAALRKTGIAESTTDCVKTALMINMENLTSEHTAEAKLESELCSTLESVADMAKPALSVPDLLNKEPVDVKLKPTGHEKRMASSPHPDKACLRISISEDDLLGNDSEDSGVPRQRCSSVENEEPHPDLLSFD